MAPAEPTSEQTRARFREVEQEAANPRSELEAVREGDCIVFRRGKGMVRFIGYLQITMFLCFGALFCGWSFSFGPWPGYIAVALVAAGMIRCFRLWRDIFPEWKHFAVDTATGSLHVFEEKGQPTVIPLAEVNCFVAWRVIESDGSLAQIYAATGDRCLQPLTGKLGSFGGEKRNARVLGYACNKAAYYVETSERVYQGTWMSSVDLRSLLAGAEFLFQPVDVNALTAAPADQASLRQHAVE